MNWINESRPELSNVMENDDQINRVTAYLKSKYYGFVGVPNVWLKDELLLPTIPQELSAMQKSVHGSNQFYDPRIIAGWIVTHETV